MLHFPCTNGADCLCRVSPAETHSSIVPARTANWLTDGFYAGNALIGPTLGNFTDLCQLPLAVFALMLCLQRRIGWLILSAAVLTPLIQEETGIMLIALIIWGAGQSLTLPKELISPPQANLSCTRLVMDSQQANHCLAYFLPKTAMTRSRSPFARRCSWCQAQPGDAALVEPSPASDSLTPLSPGLGHSHQPLSLADRWQQPPSQPVLGGA